MLSALGSLPCVVTRVWRRPPPLPDAWTWRCLPPLRLLSCVCLAQWGPRMAQCVAELRDQPGPPAGASCAGSRPGGMPKGQPSAGGPSLAHTGQAAFSLSPGSLTRGPGLTLKPDCLLPHLGKADGSLTRGPRPTLKPDVSSRAWGRTDGQGPRAREGRSGPPTWRFSVPE